jgi:hypothetical protein
MKPRRVVLQLEVETDIPINDLRKIRMIEVTNPQAIGGQPIRVIQSQADVIKKEK